MTCKIVQLELVRILNRMRCQDKTDNAKIDVHSLKMCTLSNR